MISLEWQKEKYFIDEFYSLVKGIQKINFLIPELLDSLSTLKMLPTGHFKNGYNFVLSAGERRAYTANCVIRNKNWRRKDKNGLLKINNQDAEKLALKNDYLQD